MLGDKFNWFIYLKRYVLDVNYVPDIIDENKQESFCHCLPRAFNLAGKTIMKSDIYIPNYENGKIPSKQTTWSTQGSEEDFFISENWAEISITNIWLNTHTPQIILRIRKSITTARKKVYRSNGKNPCDFENNGNSFMQTAPNITYLCRKKSNGHSWYISTQK